MSSTSGGTGLHLFTVQKYHCLQLHTPLKLFNKLNDDFVWMGTRPKILDRSITPRVLENQPLVLCMIIDDQWIAGKIIPYRTPNKLLTPYTTPDKLPTHIVG